MTVVNQPKPGSTSETVALTLDFAEGWVETTLDQLLQTLESGSRPKGGVRGIEEGIPSIGGEHLDDNGGFRFQSIKFVPHRFFERMNRGRIQAGDILIVKDGATTGKVALARDDFPYNPAVVNEHVFICRPSTDISPSFLFYFLFSKDGQDHILENFRGSAQGGINQSFAAGTAVPLAPISEQKRIVAKVEQLLALVNAARERLAKVPAILKRFRQSVLAAAFSGQLTADWRNRDSEVDLVDEILKRLEKRRLGQATTPKQKNRLKDVYSYQEKEDPRLIPENWRYVALDKLCESFQYGTSRKSQGSGKVPVLRMGNIQDGHIDWNDLVYTSNDAEIEKYRLDFGTVLFNRTNSPELVGKTGIYKGEQPAIFAGYLIRINNFDDLNTEYLNYCLNSNYAKEFCLRVKTDGVSQSNINAQKLGKFEVPFCSMKEQQEIVRRLGTLFRVADRIGTRYQKAEAHIEKLTQAILAKAFRGELVSTEAELARREGRSYEPATALLAKIEAQRKNVKPQKKRGRSRPRPRPRERIEDR
jgi:type I restriction enzyme S subunit